VDSVHGRSQKELFLALISSRCTLDKRGTLLANRVTMTSIRFALLAVALTGCGPLEKKSSACPDGKDCDSSLPRGTVHGVRTDGTVDVTVEQAWPNRPTEPPVLTGLEIAQACMAIAVCATFDPPEGGTDDAARRIALSLCAQPLIDAPAGSGPGSFFWEERAVPEMGRNERWVFEAREIIKQSGNCAGVLGLRTERPKEIVCEEAGCWWSSKSRPVPKVTCQGDVATLTSSGLTFERDCSRSLNRCDTASATGCTDRAPVGCEPAGENRCDGTVRLGCDSNGRVSFHDCARAPGGTCGATASGPGCVYPDADVCQPGSSTCEGESAKLCVFGTPELIDCKALGYGACQNGLCPLL
jgi:hypothetical protein